MNGKSEPTVYVRCGDCGDGRDITVSYHRRLIAQGRTAPCHSCRDHDRITPDDDDLWFWLEAHGVERNGITAREHVARYGLPPTLAGLLDTIRPGAL
jgi:hypothetical protein